tara:strand:+ start:419 stop:643 length:225 start_codon:yes stop_codon:yes gene_type:complete
MKSANQTYKTSGSELPFKEWLKREQLKGMLDVHEDQFLNADGGEDGYDFKSAIVPALIGMAIGYGICTYLNNRK